MNIPFTVDQFFNVFGTYNTAIWPAQVVAYLFGLLALVLAFRASKISGRIVSGVLGLFWLWMGVCYHIVYFSKVNPAAVIFGACFVLQAALFLILGTIGGKLSFKFDKRSLPVLGFCFAVYALLIYPLLGIAFGHSYPRIPMFGVAPCPTTIFTFALFLWAAKRVPLYMLLIPFLWSIIGMSAAVSLRVPQDYGLFLAGVLGTGLVVLQNRRMQKPAR
jgi:hypothetical protein